MAQLFRGSPYYWQFSKRYLEMEKVDSNGLRKILGLFEHTSVGTESGV